MQIHLVPSADNIITDKTASGQTASATPADGRDFESYLNAENNTLAAYFKEAADTYNVPVSLLTGIGMQESCFRADAVSKSGAMGIMQLMPATVEEFGCADPYDPRENIMAGAKCISSLLDKYNGNTELALAAYNAGSGNVNKYGGIPPFPETQNYVRKVLGYMRDGVTLPDGTEISPDGNISVSSASARSSISHILDSLDTDALVDLADVLFSAINKREEEPVNKQLDVAVSSSNTSSTDTAVDSGNTSVIPDGTSVMPDDYYAFQSINYNNSVLNLLAPDSDDIS